MLEGSRAAVGHLPHMCHMTVVLFYVGPGHGVCFVLACRASLAVRPVRHSTAATLGLVCNSLFLKAGQDETCAFTYSWALAEYDDHTAKL